MRPWNLSDERVSELRNQTSQKAAELTDRFGEKLATTFQKLSLNWLWATHTTSRAQVAFSLKAEFDACAETGTKFYFSRKIWNNNYSLAVPGASVAFNLYKCMVGKEPLLKNFWKHFKIEAMEV
jgi:hypothetical protein